MAHMHDLRVWTLTYAPGKKNNIQRLQEIHMLNNEMWYNVYRAMWQRILIAIPLWFFITRIAKDRYMKKNNVDSHDTSFRDVTAHM
jgi:TRAP-type mannitol/chloroaromatic compound transport system permease large subunit